MALPLTLSNISKLAAGQSIFENPTNNELYVVGVDTASGSTPAIYNVNGDGSSIASATATELDAANAPSMATGTALSACQYRSDSTILILCYVQVTTNNYVFTTFDMDTETYSGTETLLVSDPAPTLTREIACVAGGTSADTTNPTRWYFGIRAADEKVMGSDYGRAGFYYVDGIGASPSITSISDPISQAGVESIYNITGALNVDTLQGYSYIGVTGNNQSHLVEFTSGGTTATGNTDSLNALEEGTHYVPKNKSGVAAYNCLGAAELTYEISDPLGSNYYDTNICPTFASANAHCFASELIGGQHYALLLNATNNDIELYRSSTSTFATGDLDQTLNTDAQNASPAERVHAYNYNDSAFVYVYRTSSNAVVIDEHLFPTVVNVTGVSVVSRVGTEQSVWHSQIYEQNLRSQINNARGTDFDWVDFHELTAYASRGSEMNSLVDGSGNRYIFGGVRDLTNETIMPVVMKCSSGVITDDWEVQDPAGAPVVTAVNTIGLGRVYFARYTFSTNNFMYCLIEDRNSGDYYRDVYRYNLTTDQWESTPIVEDSVAGTSAVSNIFITNEASPKIITAQNDFVGTDTMEIHRFSGGSWSVFDVDTQTANDERHIGFFGSKTTNNVYVYYEVGTVGRRYSVFDAAGGSWRSRGNTSNISWASGDYTGSVQGAYIALQDNAANDIGVRPLPTGGSGSLTTNPFDLYSIEDTNTGGGETLIFDNPSSDAAGTGASTRLSMTSDSLDVIRAYYFENVSGNTWKVREAITGQGDLTFGAPEDVVQFTFLGTLNDEFAVLAHEASDGATVIGVSETSQGTVMLYFLNQGDANASVSGVSSQGFVGTVTTNNESVEPTGVSATSAAGSVTVNSAVNQTVTGEEATGTAGTATSSAGITQAVTGESVTGATGTATSTAGVSATVTGEQVTGSEGTATAGGSETVTVTGEGVTGTAENVTVTGVANVPVTGEAGTTALGDETVSADQVISVGSLQAVGSEGSVTVDNTTLVSVTGEAGTSAVGTVTVTGDSIFNATGESVTGSDGTVTVTEGTGHTENLVGEQATGTVGTITFFTSTVLAPTSDVSSGTWQPSTGVSLFGVLDEASPDDGDYAFTEDPVNDTMRLGFPSVTDPEASHGHVVSYRYEKQSTGTINLTVTLYSGVTQIAQWTHNNISQSVVQQDQTLTESQANAITDYTALEIEFTANLV